MKRRDFLRRSVLAPAAMVAAKVASALPATQASSTQAPTLTLDSGYAIQAAIGRMPGAISQAKYMNEMITSRLVSVESARAMLGIEWP